jgi:hypothetical protein
VAENLWEPRSGCVKGQGFLDEFHDVQLVPRQTIAEHGVEEDHEFTHAGDDDDLGSLALAAKV